jgi:hypothetical protein
LSENGTGVHFVLSSTIWLQANTAPLDDDEDEELLDDDEDEELLDEELDELLE